jgi:hypothetical protein
MAATLHELFAGRTETLGAKPKAEIAYVVLGAADEAAVRALALAQIPTTYAGLNRTAISLDERLNGTTWKVVATYEAPEPHQQDNPESTFAFDTGGGTQHVTQSLQTVGRYGPAASSGLGGAIGYDGQNVAGVDITIPVYQFSEMHYIAPSYVSQAYKLALMGLTGAVNSMPFRGFQAGEVLFMGASGTRRGTDPDDRWEIAYKFAASPNQNGLTVGAISGIQKRGWDYLWVQYGDDVDPTAKVLIKKPIAVYVEQVYPFASFGGLGIGS